MFSGSEPITKVPRTLSSRLTGKRGMSLWVRRHRQRTYYMDKTLIRFDEARRIVSKLGERSRVRLGPGFRGGHNKAGPRAFPWGGPLFFLPARVLLRYVSHVFFVFEADVLEHVGIGQQPFHEIDREGFGERLRVGDRHCHVDVAEVAAREALLDPQVLAVAVPPGVEPAEVVEAQRVDHEGTKASLRFT